MVLNRLVVYVLIHFDSKKCSHVRYRQELTAAKTEIW